MFLVFAAPGETQSLKRDLASRAARLCRRPAAARGEFQGARTARVLRLVEDDTATLRVFVVRVCFHCGSIPSEPEELWRAGRDVRVRAGRAGKVGERAGDGGRGLQIETGVGPTQHQLIVQSFENQDEQTTKLIKGLLPHAMPERIVRT